MPNSERGFVVPLALLVIVIVVSGIIVGGSLVLRALTGKENQVTQIISLPTPVPKAIVNTTPSCSDKNIYQIESQDMFPSYFQSDTWQYEEFQGNSLQRGEVVVLKNPFEKEGQVIRRVIGLPGESIKIQSNRVYINGEVLSEAYLHDTFPEIEPDFIKNNRDFLIPLGKVVLLADNRSTLSDSRNWGFVEVNELEATLIKKVTPCTKSNVILRPENDETIKNDITILHDLLDCHFTRDKKFPKDVYAINNACLKEFNYVVHFNPNTNAPFDYVLSKGAKDYHLKAKISTNKDYSSTGNDLYYDGNSLFKEPDKLRISDFNTIKDVIETTLEEKGSARNVLCFGRYSCSGKTSPTGKNTLLVDGTGWIQIKSIALPVLPVDPKNTTKFHYSYCAQGEKWEINLVLAASENKSMMVNDGGDNPNRYEVGNDLKLFDKVGCFY